MDEAWRDMTRRTVLGTAAMTGAAAVMRTAGAQPVPTPDPSKPFYSAAAESLPYRPLRVKSSDGTGIAAQEWGNPQGKEIVLIHGVLQSNLSFERQFRSDLAKEFRIVTYDLRAHGDSEAPIGQEHYLNGELWADDLAAVMAGAGLRKPVLVGWSLGGLPMGNYLTKFGDAQLAGLNFVDALTKRDRAFAGLPENRTLLPSAASPDLSTRIDAVRGFVRSCFKTQPDQADFERMVAFNSEVPRSALSHILVGIPLNAEEAYRKVRVPVLVTHGADDGQISSRITEYDKSVMPHATVSIYDDCGHSPFWEKASRFNQELATFVRKANA